MLFYTVGQSRIFLTMLYAGMIAGGYILIDRALRRLFEAGRLLGLMMDLVMGAVLGCIVILGLMIASDGELRLYSILGTVCGYILFMATFGQLIPRLCSALLKPICALLRILRRSRLIGHILK